MSHLDIDEQLPEVPWGHHHGCVQLCDVAFVQSNVMISCEALNIFRTEKIKKDS